MHRLKTRNLLTFMQSACRAFAPSASLHRLRSFGCLSWCTPSFFLFALCFSHCVQSQATPANQKGSREVVQVTSPSKVTQHRPLKVMYISPFITIFWAEVRRFMEEVASDLDIEFTYIDAGSRFQTLQAVEQIKNLKDVPDYLVFQYQRDLSKQVFEAAHARGIRTFVINTDIYQEELAEIGRPREKMPLWIGQMFSDNFESGYQLADKLIDAAHQQFPEKKELQMLAIGGELYSIVAQKRNKGMLARVDDGEGVKVKRSIFINWLEKTSYDSTRELLSMYPDIDIIWAASDLLARGSMSAMEELGKKPGKDIVVGGIDWSLYGAKSIAEGKMNLSIGSHFMEGGWALLLIHDFHHGLDFNKALGVRIKNRMAMIDASNAAQFAKLFEGDEWKKVNFRQFSKFYNSELTNYDFSLNKIIQEYELATTKQK